ncbi:MAG: 1-phosphofructokinase family hexose kinase [Amphiplicatus sp.]
MADILTVTINPAIDIAASIDRLEADVKLRCADPHTDPGGGGVNVARALKALGADSDAFVTIGGPTGELLLRLLEGEGVNVLRFPIDGVTRQSFTINETATGRQYRFILPGPDWSEPLWRKALSEIIRLSADKAYVVLSGSLAPGVPDDFYLQIARGIADAPTRIILDTSGPALGAALKQERSAFFCIRMNRTEAKAFAGCDLDSPEHAQACAQELAKRDIAQIVIVTMGEKGAALASAEEAFFVAAPRVETVSAVGAGDCFVAAFTLGLSQGWPLKRAGGYGAAAAAAAMMTPATVLCRRTDTDRLFAEILKAGRAY